MLLQALRNVADPYLREIEKTLTKKEKRRASYKPNTQN